MLGSAKIAKRGALVLTLALSLLITPGVTPGGMAQGRPEEHPGAFDASSRKPASEDLNRAEAAARQDGEARVIVGLRTSFVPEGASSSAQRGSQRSQIAREQAGLREELAGTEYEEHHAYQTVPYMALSLSREAVRAMRSSDHVASIHMDEPAPPALAQSSPLVTANIMWGTGFTGSGRTVAILDTGVDKGHSFFGSRVTEEACYSWNGAGSTSLCPNGQSSQTGAGSGVHCIGIEGCDHGTHVAGIAAGNGSAAGVARGANIMSVQVFSRFTGTRCTDFGSASPCVLSWSSDQLAGLERVYARRGAHSFAAVNLSLGGGRFTQSCDGDSRKSIIDNLRSVGIATVIASGNDGYTNAVTSPGCISTAVTVGSTTKQDAVSSWSNRHPTMVNLLAPGSQIRSSVPGGGFSTFSGTSMATPHVAGAFALLAQAHPGTTVNERLIALRDTGVLVGSGHSTPRIRVAQASSSISPLQPGQALLSAPSGDIDTSQPAYAWGAVSGATQYQLYVNRGSTNVINRWVKSGEAECAATCSFTPATTLATGAHTWWIRTWNAAGYGPWSEGTTFSPPGPPGAATLSSPSGDIESSQPAYAWSAVTGATHYQLYVSHGSTKLIDRWVTATEAGCGTTCSFVDSTALASGSHTWWIRTWNPSGYGPWSSGMSFTTPTPLAPGAAVLVSPSGPGPSNPVTYEWDALPGSTWYYLWVNRGSTNVIKRWYTAEEVGCSDGGTCSITPPTTLMTGAHTWWIQTWSPSGYGPWSAPTNFSVQ